MSIEMFSILFKSIEYFFNLIEILILVRVIMSWLPVDANRGLPGLVYSLTEPILGPIRGVLRRSPIGGMPLDISPIIAILFINLVYRLIMSAIFQIIT